MKRSDFDKMMKGSSAKIRGDLPPEEKGKSRVNSKKVFLDGNWFDSQSESDISWEFKVDPNIQILELQPKFELLPAFERFGVKYRSIDFTPDFRILENGVELVVEAKSIGTLKANSKSYPMRRKLFLSQNPDLRFKEIIFDRGNRVEKTY